VAELPVLYTFLVRWKEMREAAQTAHAEWPLPPSGKDAYEQFLSIAKKKNVTALREGQSGFGELDQAVKRAGS
jgi:hypothetical protein